MMLHQYPPILQRWLGYNIIHTIERKIDPFKSDMLKEIEAKKRLNKEEAKNKRKAQLDEIVKHFPNDFSVYNMLEVIYKGVDLSHPVKLQKATFACNQIVYKLKSDGYVVESRRVGTIKYWKPIVKFN